MEPQWEPQVLGIYFFEEKGIEQMTSTKYYFNIAEVSLYCRAGVQEGETGGGKLPL